MQSNEVFSVSGVGQENPKTIEWLATSDSDALLKGLANLNIHNEEYSFGKISDTDYKLFANTNNRRKEDMQSRKDNSRKRFQPYNMKHRNQTEELVTRLESLSETEKHTNKTIDDVNSELKRMKDNGYILVSRRKLLSRTFKRSASV